MDINKLIKGVVGVGKAVAMLDPRVAGVIDAVEKTVEVVKQIRETADLPADRIAELDETREALEARVNAHADKTAQSLAD